jgi:hypothetical protein
MKASDLTLAMTCGSHPEQYDVLFHGETLGYLHYRWGVFEIVLYLFSFDTPIASEVLGSEYEGELPEEKREAILQGALEKIAAYYPYYQKRLALQAEEQWGNGAPYGLYHAKKIKNSPRQNQHYLFISSSLLKGQFTGGVSLPDYWDKVNGCHSEKLIVEGGDVFDEKEENVFDKVEAYSNKGPLAGIFIEVSPFGVFSPQVLASQKSLEESLKKLLAILEARYRCPIYVYTLPYPLSEDYLFTVLSLRSFKKSWGLRLIDFFNPGQFSDAPGRKARLYFPDGAHPSKAALKELFLPKFLAIKEEKKNAK